MLVCALMLLPMLLQHAHRVLPITSTCAELDVDQKTLDACLSYLQQDPVEPYVEVLSSVAATLDVRFHK